MHFMVRTTDERFLEMLRRYMGSFRVDEAHVDEVVVSADCGTERILPGGKRVEGRLNLYFGSMWIYRGRSMEEMVARLAGYLRAMSTYYQDEFVRIRAGAVDINGRALLLPSSPEPHLASLVGLLLKDGAGYLGDEQVHLEPILRRVHSSGLPLMIDSQDVELFPLLNRKRPRRRSRDDQPRDLRAVTPRQAVAPEELGGRWADPAPVGWIVFPDFGQDETKLEPAAGADAVFRFSQGVMNLHVWGERAFVLMQELIEEAPVSRLAVGSLEEAASLLLRTAPSMVGEVTA
jgi:hypothetical protein